MSASTTQIEPAHGVSHVSPKRPPCAREIGARSTTRASRASTRAIWSLPVNHTSVPTGRNQPASPPNGEAMRFVIRPVDGSTCTSEKGRRFQTQNAPLPVTASAGMAMSVVGMCATSRPFRASTTATPGGTDASAVPSADVSARTIAAVAAASRPSAPIATSLQLRRRARAVRARATPRVGSWRSMRPSSSCSGRPGSSPSSSRSRATPRR